MLNITYLLFLFLTGFMVPFSYYMVTMNGSGYFPIQSKSYIESPYWLDLGATARRILVFFQLFAAVGYLVFQIWISYELDTFTGLLSNRLILVLLEFSLLTSASLWPVGAYFVLKYPTSAISTWIACIMLWITAACGLIYLFAFSQEQAPLYIILSSIFFCLVVVGADGIVWSALRFRKLLRELHYI